MSATAADNTHRNTHNGKQRHLALNDRRRKSRVTCQFPARIQFIFPDDTFTPYQSIVLVTDVSHNGVKVVCPRLDTDGQARKLRQGQFGRMTLRLGERLVRGYCEIIWVRAKQELDGRFFYEVGMAYDLRDEETELFVDVMLDRAREEKPADETPAH